MKRVIYIGIAAVALVFTSCQKEIIEPNSSSNIFDVSTMSSDARYGDDEELTPNGDDTDGGGIVDPNGEEDGSDKPRQQSGN